MAAEVRYQAIDRDLRITVRHRGDRSNRKLGHVRADLVGFFEVSFPMEPGRGSQYLALAVKNWKVISTQMYKVGIVSKYLCLPDDLAAQSTRQRYEPYRPRYVAYRLERCLQCLLLSDTGKRRISRHGRGICGPIPRYIVGRTHT